MRSIKNNLYGGSNRPTNNVIKAGKILTNLKTNSKKNKLNVAKLMIKMSKSKPKSKPKPKAYNINEYSSSPTGWSGPAKMKYILGTAKGTDGKALNFKSFDEAINVANRYGHCSGITKTSRAYSLRIGSELIETPTSKTTSGLASWIKDLSLIHI